MSTSPKPDLARGFLRAEKLLEEEGDRLATMSDEDFEREMSALPDHERVPTAEELLARGAERAAKRIEGASAGAAGGAKVKAFPVRSRKMSWVSGLMAAAVVALVIAVAARRPEEVASPSQGDAGAARLREEAYAACGAKQWRECGDKLREAKDLDPAGDTDPRAQAAYRAALEGLSEAGPKGPR